MNFKPFLDLATITAKDAGKILSNGYAKQHLSQEKSDKSFITEIDLESNDLIIRNISKTFPEHAILSEESGKSEKDSDYSWVIDPLDGTSNFIHHIPFYCISIALIYKNEPIVAVVYDSLRNELFSASKNHGTYLNGKKIVISPKDPKKTSYISLIYSRDSLQKNHSNCIFFALNPPEFRIRNLGAAALELAYVASNRLDGLTIMGNNPWDVYAGILLIQEAGGDVTDRKNLPWCSESNNIVAGQKDIHEKILHAISMCE